MFYPLINQYPLFTLIKKEVEWFNKMYYFFLNKDETFDKPDSHWFLKTAFLKGALKQVIFCTYDFSYHFRWSYLNINDTVGFFSFSHKKNYILKETGHTNTEKWLGATLILQKSRKKNNFRRYTENSYLSRKMCFQFLSDELVLAFWYIDFIISAAVCSYTRWALWF